jgi:hypothetical protein
MVLCTLVILLVAASAHGQVNTPTSGAMLTINNGSVNGINVNIVIYDSQIHSGQLGAAALPAPCVAADSVVTTDAYVLQGGSATGCDTGDAYEVTDGNGPAIVSGNVVHQSFGTKDITMSQGQLAGSQALPGTGFHIETHYCINGSACNAPGIGGSIAQWCNTATGGSICANPDTGFLSVTNNTGYPFTGTITLQGNSKIAAGSYCPTAGVAVDSSNTLAAGATVVLALGTEGHDAVGLSDSSNCGGFNFDQQGALLISPPNAPTIFQAHNDDFIVQCNNCNAGDMATWRPVPVPLNLFTILADSTVGLIPPEKCIPYADFSSPNAAQPNGVCVLFQTHCLNGGVTCADAETFSWLGTFDYIIDANTIPNPIGGVHFLGDPGVNCAASLTYSSDTVISYTGAQPGVDPIPPQHSGSGGGLNCFVTTYEPTAPPIAVGSTVSSVTAFSPPVVNDGPANQYQAGRTVPLKAHVTTGPGSTTPLTNLNYCNNPSTPGACTYPWISFIKSPPTSCGAVTTVITDAPPDSNSGFQNLGNGDYQLNWKTSKSWAGYCITVNTIYNGLILTGVANGGNAVFKFTQ